MSSGLGEAPADVEAGRVLDAWLDLLHGSRCVGCGRPGRVLCQPCRASLPSVSFAARPDPCPPGLVPCRVAGEYAGLLQQLVISHKEHRVFGLVASLGEMLALAAAPMVGEHTVLVPVPTRRAMVRHRGHDPTVRIVRAAASVLRAAGGDVWVQPLLGHRLPVADQAGLGASERARNRADTLVLRPAQRAALARSGPIPRLVVCDDVLTTGSTAREAQRALADAGLEVSGVACVAATRKRF